MSILSAVNPLHEALDFHLSRQNLLTANLAQVETPGFRAKELYRTNTFDGVLALEMEGTDDMHQGASAGPDDWMVKADPHAPVGPDGNSVSLDREAVKVASNNLRYDAVTTFTRGRIESLLWAARDGR